MKAYESIRHFKLLLPTDTFSQRIVASNSGAAVFTSRLVYSFLAHRCRINGGASTRSLREELFLHADTVSAAIRSLGDLVQRRGNEWIALEPPVSMFYPMKLKDVPEFWGDRIAYTMLYLPKRGARIEYPTTSRCFGMNHALIWSHLNGRAKSGVVLGFTCAGAGKLFGLTSKTVSSIVNDLHWAKLITREEYARGSNITLVANEVALLEFFQPKPKAEAATKVEPVEKKSPSAPASYQFNNDIWDQGRRLCQPLMAQKTCEAIIKKAVKLGDSADQFENAVVAAKRRHDDNLKSGNVFKGNFGKFLTAIYDNRIAVIDEQKKKQAEEQRLEDYFNSDDFKEKQRAIEKEAAADPNHPQHFLTIDSILDRVRFNKNPVKNHQSADSVLTKLRSSISSLIISKGTYSADVENQMVHKILALILKPALSKLNNYYLKDQRGTLDEFKRELNLSIGMNAPGLKDFCMATANPQLSTAIAAVDNQPPAPIPS